VIRQIIREQITIQASFDIVIRVHKTFYKENFKQIENEIKSLIKSLPI